MKLLTYNSRNPNASDVLNFGTPEGNVQLNNGVPSAVKDSQVTFLEENVDEYKICLKREIITVKDAPTSPGSTLEETSNSEFDEDEVENQPTGEVMVPKSTTTKTVTTKK